MSNFSIDPNKVNAVGSTMDGISGKLDQICNEVSSISTNLTISDESAAYIRSALSRIQESITGEAVSTKSVADALRESARLYEQTDNLLAGITTEGNTSIIDNFAAIMEMIIQWIYSLLDDNGNVSGGTNEDDTYVGDPVNTCTGNYVSDILELRYQGQPALEFIRHYNSLYIMDGPMGMGWTHNYQISLQQGEGNLDLTLGNQWRERFDYTEEGIYRSRHDSRSFISVEEGAMATERAEDSEDVINTRKYIYFQGKENVFFFDEEGRVTEISSRGGKRIRLAYKDGRLAQAKDCMDRMFSYEYDGNGHLVCVRDHVGREIAMEYTGNCLSAVISADGRRKTYAYDESGRLRNIKNNAGTMVIWNDYDGENRVVLQRLPDGTKMSYAYEDDRVTVTERNGAVTTYCHNKLFQITDIMRSDGTKSFAYDESRRRVSVKTAAGAEYRREYDSEGNVSALTDPMGYRVEMSYQEKGLPSSIREKDGGISRMEYDEEGNITRYEDALGNVTVFERKNGLLTGIVRPDGSSEAFEYDAHENLICRTDAEGHRTEYGYDAADRVVTVTDGRGNTYSRTYDACDRILTVTNPLGETMAYTYSETGKIASILDYDGTSREWIYNELDLVSAFINKNGSMTGYTYDANENLASISLPNGGVVSFKYDEYNRRISKVDELGLETVYEYDPDGRLIREKVGEHVRSFEYDVRGLLKRVCEKDGGTSFVERDSMGHVTALTRSDGSRFSYSYDLLGRCTKKVDAAGSETDYTYDSCGRLTGIVRDGIQLRSYDWYSDGKLREAGAADGTILAYAYDEAGNLSEKRSATGYAMSYEYDGLGRRILVRDSAGRKSEVSYDEGGRISEYKDERGNATKYSYSATGKLLCAEDSLENRAYYEYNEMDLMTRITAGEGEDVRTTCIERNARGQITGILDAEGNRNRYEYNEYGQMVLHETPELGQTRFSYDAFGRTTGIRYSDGRSVDMSYDMLGRMTAMTDWDGSMEVEYDPMGRPVSVKDTSGNMLRYSHDRAGHRTALQYPDGRTASYVVDGAGRPSEIRTDAGSIRFTYGENGLVNCKEADGARVLYEYLEDGRTGSITYYDAAGKESEISLTYDACGNIETKTTWYRDQDVTTVLSYEYDELGRLTSVLENGEPIRVYAYDAFGNRIYAKEGGAETTSSYNRLNQLVSQTVKEENGEITKIFWQYDKNGNAVSKSVGDKTVKMSYDAAGKLSEVFDADGGKTVYHYDGLGMRREKKAFCNGKDVSETFVYDYADGHSPMVFSRGPQGTTDYLWNGEAAGAVRDGKLHFYQCDQQGSVLRFLSDEGTLLEKYGYDEFGTDLTGTAGILQPFGYTGLVFDNAAGGWNTPARTYAPGIGRFLQKDQERFIHSGNPQSINLYAYCLNNPILYVDPDGNDCYYFYLPEWRSEADADQRALAEQYGYDIDQVHLIPVTSQDELTQGWNSMGTVNGQTVDIDTVVINSHANPEVLGFGNSGNRSFDARDALNLNNQSMDQLILYGCNAGHRDYSDSNIANAFSQRTNGAPVMASDGTVSCRQGDGAYASMGDEHFRQWAEYAGNGDRENEGWLIYQQVDGETVVTSTGLTRMTVQEMMDSLRSMNGKDHAE